MILRCYPFLVKEIEDYFYYDDQEGLISGEIEGIALQARGQIPEDYPERYPQGVEFEASLSFDPLFTPLFYRRIIVFHRPGGKDIFEDESWISITGQITEVRDNVFLVDSLLEIPVITETVPPSDFKGHALEVGQWVKVTGAFLLEFEPWDNEAYFDLYPNKKENFTPPYSADLYRPPKNNAT